MGGAAATSAAFDSMLKDTARRRFDVLMVAAIDRTKLQASVLAMSRAIRCAGRFSACLLGHLKRFKTASPGR